MAELCLLGSKDSNAIWVKKMAMRNAHSRFNGNEQSHITRVQNKFIKSTGSPSSKYEHRRASALLRTVQNIRICMGNKPIVSVSYEIERISIKKQLTLLKMCVTSPLCGPRVDLWPFYGFYRTLVFMGVQRIAPTDSPFPEL